MLSKLLLAVFLVLAIFGCWSAEATVSEASEGGDEAFTYSCLNSELFTLYNQSNEYVIAECSPSVVCNQARACTPGPCGLQFSYINSVNRYPGGNTETKCCHLSPEPNGQESCTTVQVNDKHYLARKGDESTMKKMFGGASPLKLNGQAGSNAVDMPKVRAAALHALQARRRRKRNGEGAEDIVLNADVWLMELKDRTAPYSYLKKIENTPSGYSATLCTIQCSSSTSTMSSRPTTQRHTQQQQPTTAPVQQEKKETPHKKGLFNGHGCFSGEMTVETPQGSKRMDQLHAGDRVLVYSTDSKSGRSYQPIEWFYHRDPNQTIDYINLETRSGYRLSITANHLIPFVPCSSEAITPTEMDRLVIAHSRFASRAKLGSCLAVQSGDGFVADQITKISTERKRGVFSPITDQGTLVANGVQASCYSSLENQAVQKGIHSILIKGKRMGQQIWNSFSLLTLEGKTAGIEEREIPDILKFLLNLANSIMPSLVFN